MSKLSGDAQGKMNVVSAMTPTTKDWSLFNKITQKSQMSRLKLQEKPVHDSEKFVGPAFTGLLNTDQRYTYLGRFRDLPE